jgi:hypothetical protein
LRASAGVELIKLDLSAEGATDALRTTYDAIFHFAILGVANVIGSPYDTLTINIALTLPVQSRTDAELCNSGCQCNRPHPSRESRIDERPGFREMT